MARELEGHRALVTGAASGIGRAIAEALAAQGARVAVHARTKERGAATTAAIEAAGGHGVSVAADLEDRAAVDRLCDDALTALGGLDIVVHNAGIAEKAPVLETAEDMWDRTMAINLKVPYVVTRRTLPAMIESGGGRQIYIASIAGKLAEPNGSAYVTSKAALLGFMRCVAADMGRHGVTANAICPGWTDTDMAKRLHAEMREGSEDLEDFYDRSMRGNMLGARIGPADIADMAVFLAGPRSRFVTAQAFNVDAGLCLG